MFDVEYDRKRGRNERAGPAGDGARRQRAGRVPGGREVQEQ